MPNEYSAQYDVVPPSRADLAALAEKLHIPLTDDELDVFVETMKGSVESYRRLRDLPEPRPEVRYPRTPGYRPTGDENPYNAWYWKCSIRGRADGLLAGKSVAVKDNVCVAGVPMSNGSAVLEGFVPDIDATIVTRILDAGGEIAGKAVAEAFGLSSGSNTASTGAVLNPRRPTHSTGGSSSGSAALVAAGDCDLAIGTDQGGSVRIPASLCGIFGLKPTYGLVPYTGVLPIEHTLDHVGPMARSAEDLALLLEAIAGPDGYDPRQAGAPEPPSYRDHLEGRLDGLRVGVLREGFGWSEEHTKAEQTVRASIGSLRDLGADVRDVSVPLHVEGGHVVTPIYAEGIASQLVAGRGLGTGWKGYYPTTALDFIHRSFQTSLRNLSATGKLFLLLGTYMIDNYGGRYYARAQNIVRLLRDAYDAALAEVDVLAMPTCAPEPVALPHIANPTMLDVFAGGFGYHLNTAPFNVTEHPAITVPCGTYETLPLGMMLVGRHFEERTLLRAAHAFETA
jgi:amidase